MGHENLYAIQTIILHNTLASFLILSRMYQCKPASVTTSTRHPGRSSRFCINPAWSRRLLPCSKSTRRSRSLPSVSSSRCTDPNTRIFPAPYRDAMRRISSRFSWSRCRRPGTSPHPLTRHCGKTPYHDSGGESGSCNGAYHGTGSRRVRAGCTRLLSSMPYLIPKVTGQENPADLVPFQDDPDDGRTNTPHIRYPPGRVAHCRMAGRVIPAHDSHTDPPASRPGPPASTALRSARLRMTGYGSSKLAQRSALHAHPAPKRGISRRRRRPLNPLQTAFGSSKNLRSSL